MDESPFVEDELFVDVVVVDVEVDDEEEIILFLLFNREVLFGTKDVVDDDDDEPPWSPERHESFDGLFDLFDNKSLS